MFSPPLSHLREFKDSLLTYVALFVLCFDLFIFFTLTGVDVVRCCQLPVSSCVGEDEKNTTPLLFPSGL